MEFEKLYNEIRETLDTKKKYFKFQIADFHAELGEDKIKVNERHEKEGSLAQFVKYHKINTYVKPFLQEKL